MNSLAVIKSQNRLRLEHVARKLADAVEQATTTKSVDAYKELVDALNLYKEWKEQNAVL